MINLDSNITVSFVNNGIVIKSTKMDALGTGGVQSQSQTEVFVKKSHALKRLKELLDEQAKVE